jgi:cytochrome d ubiquinol oxidase subunit I
MSALALARWQFAITTVYHFFFVPLTLGLSILVALMETLYVRSGDEVYKRMTKFWGKLFLINFALGVATGIVQEFQFGMNWSEYSRFVGDIFGAPLAIEALLAFFLESTFLGIWIFGWDRLPKALHAATIWLVAIGSNLSALWILIANSFMQEPVGYAVNNGRAEMTDFGALITNPHVWVQFPHVLFSAMTTAAFFVLGVSAYHLLKQAVGTRDARSRKSNRPAPARKKRATAAPANDLFRRSFRMALVYGLIGSVLVALVGHTQGQEMFKSQPMKMAAAEALWATEQPASLSLLTIGNLKDQEIFSIRVPALLSLLACNNLTCEVRGMNSIQAEYEQKYGPGSYEPPIAVSYWAFRGMLTPGLLMPLLVAIGLYLVLKERLERQPRYLRVLTWAIPLPYIANTSGWILTEVGRQPWIVFGLMKTQDAVSPVVSSGAVFLSLALFILLYAALLAADIYLLARFARQETAEAA